MRGVQLARRVAWFATFLVAALLLVLLLFRAQAAQLTEDHAGELKLVGLVIGPILAVLGFFWGVVDKYELKELAEQLGFARKAQEDAGDEVRKARDELEVKRARIESLQTDLTTIADSGRLWKLRRNDPFPEYRGWKFDPEGAKVVTIGLFKGGVGKSHLAANFAAYVSERRQKPVLIVDLDYQGSLSAMMLTAAGIEPVGSSVDALFAEDADLATLSSKSIQLASNGSSTALNNGLGLSRAWLVPADYTLAEVESRLLVNRVIHNTSKLDERYRLAHLLLNPHVRRQYSLIIIDTPPRMTLGTVNALVASHHYIVPTILDRVSSEAVRPYLTQVETLKADLALNLELAGIVATMTRQSELTGSEPRFGSQVRETVKDVVGSDLDPMIARNLPRRVQVTTSDDLGYFLRDANGPLRSQFYDPIFDELWTRIMGPRESG